MTTVNAKMAGLPARKRTGSLAKSSDLGRQPKEPDTTRYGGRLALRIRELREAAGLTVEQLAERITKAGYTTKTPTLYHWQNGTREPNIDALPAIARALKVSIADLMPEK